MTRSLNILAVFSWVSWFIELHWKFVFSIVDIFITSKAIGSPWQIYLDFERSLPVQTSCLFVYHREIGHQATHTLSP